MAAGCDGDEGRGDEKTHFAKYVAHSGASEVRRRWAGGADWRASGLAVEGAAILCLATQQMQRAWSWPRFAACECERVRVSVGVGGRVRVCACVCVYVCVRQWRGG